MKTVAIFVLLLLKFASSLEDASNFIVGGNAVAIEDYPYMAGIVNFGWSTCGAAIITPRSVLTAAHCFILPSFLPSVSVFVGTSRRSGEGGQTHRVLRISVHPDYVIGWRDDFKIANDIAVVRTITSIRFGRSVQPIPLGTRSVSSGSQVLFTGWGLINQSPMVFPDQLQKLEMSTITNLRCALIHRGTIGEGQVTSEMMCGVTNGEKGACSGDSGSPLVWRGSLVGVVSWIVRPCGSHPTVFVRVSHHLRWIQQHI